MVGNKGPALHRMKNLGGVETAGTQVTVGKQRPPLVNHTESVGGVVNDFQRVPLGNGRYFFYCTRVAVHVGGHDGLGIGRNGSFDQRGVDVKRVPVDVHEHGRAIFP